MSVYILLIRTILLLLRVIFITVCRVGTLILFRIAKLIFNGAYSISTLIFTKSAKSIFFYKNQPVGNIIPRQNSTMEEVVCDICITEYDGKRSIPRVLQCGHTLCSSCIENLLQTSKICPKCRKAMSPRNNKDYPVNYALLGILDGIKNDTQLQTQTERRLDKLIKKYVVMESRLLENKKHTDTTLASVQDGLKCLRKLRNLTIYTDLSVINEQIRDLNEELEDINNKSIRDYYSLKNSIDLKYEQYQGIQDFLFEIYNRSASGEKLYAVSSIEGNVKFAQISVWGNRMLIHAFEIGLPYDEPAVRTCWFQDLKMCLDSTQIRAFLEVCCNDDGTRQMIVIKPSNSSLVPQFLKFCTGEAGPVYKGTSFHQGSSTINYIDSIFQVDKFIYNEREQTGNFDYVLSSDNRKTYATNDVLLTGSADGGIQLIKLSYKVEVSDVIGVIEEPQDIAARINHASNRKITDSGLVIYL